MMAGNPNWWSMINGMHPQAATSQFVYGSPNFPSNSAADHDHHPSQDFPTVRSWSQLLLGGLGGGGEERFAGNLFQQQHKRLTENWEDNRLLNLNPSLIPRVPVVDHVKQELAQSISSAQFYDNNNEFHQPNRSSSNNCWPHNLPAVSSPSSCTTTSAFSNSFLNFSGSKTAPVPSQGRKHHRNQDHSSEGNSTSSGGVQPKKSRVQQSSAQPALKVRKEKLGDRITALHQLVSPFGKTDTASVLSEAIGYIRFLEAQIEALSSPYMRNGDASANHRTLQHQHSDSEGPGVKDLRSRGLCLVPISFTQNVPGSADHGGADYWAPPSYGGGASAF